MLKTFAKLYFCSKDYCINYSILVFIMLHVRIWESKAIKRTVTGQMIFAFIVFLNGAIEFFGIP